VDKIPKARLGEGIATAEHEISGGTEQSIVVQWQYSLITMTVDLAYIKYLTAGSLQQLGS
jgi:hypothetical protein